MTIGDVTVTVTGSGTIPTAPVVTVMVPVETVTVVGSGTTSCAGITVSVPAVTLTVAATGTTGCSATTVTELAVTVTVTGSSSRFLALVVIVIRPAVTAGREQC